MSSSLLSRADEYLKHAEDQANLLGGFTSTPLQPTNQRDEHENSSRINFSPSQSSAYFPQQTPIKGFNSRLPRLSAADISFRPSPLDDGSPSNDIDHSEFNLISSQTNTRNSHQLFDTSTINPQEIYSYDATGEENNFHNFVEKFMETKNEKKLGVNFQDANQQCDLMNDYLEDSNHRYHQALEKSARSRELGVQNDIKCEHTRSERDFWALLNLFYKNDLFLDIDDHEAENKLHEVCELFPLNKSLPSLIESCLNADQRIKKAHVILEWLETSACDLIHEPPAMTRLSQLNTMNPDSQIHSNGLFQKLQNDEDNSDQESLMKVIWQCIRSGQLTRALEISYKYRCFWLTACLQGGIMEYYHTVSTSPNFIQVSDSVLERKGNTNRAMWLRTCWKYSEELYSSLQLNYTQSIKSHTPSSSTTRSFPSSSSSSSQNYSNYNHDVALLEYTIYSALCSHYSILKESKLIQSWSDHLWAYLRCNYERSLMTITHTLHEKRIQNSLYYPGVTKTNLKAEIEYLEKTKQYSTALIKNYEDIQEHISSPSTYHTSPITIHLLNLQQSVILGYQAMKKHLSNTIIPYALSCSSSEAGGGGGGVISQLFHQSTKSLSSLQRKDFSSTASTSISTSISSDINTATRSTILRVYAHYLLWLFYSCPYSPHLHSLVTYEQLSIVLEAYILELITLKRYHLVALYTSYLLKSKRISIYSKMMILLSPEGKYGLDGSSAAEILRLGYVYFGKEEMNEITHEVINYSRHLGNHQINHEESVYEDPMTSFTSNTALSALDESLSFTPMTKSHSNNQNTTLRSGQSFYTTRGPTYPTRSNWIPESPGFTATPMTLRNSSSKLPFHSTYRTVDGHENFFNSTVTTNTNNTATINAIPDLNVNGLTRMESLKWLCLRKDESFIALIESNNFMKSLILESNNSNKYQQINEILTNILTTTHFLDIFEEYKVVEEKIQNPHLEGVNFSHEDSFLTIYEQLLIHNFDSQLSLLLFWKRYNKILIQYRQWSVDLMKLKQQYQQNSQSVALAASHFQDKLTRSSSELTRMILGLFDCEEEEEDEKRHEIENLLGRNQIKEEKLLNRLVECMISYEGMWKSHVTASFLSLRVSLTEYLNHSNDQTHSDSISSDHLHELQQEINSLHTYFQSFSSMNSLLQSSHFECGIKWIPSEGISIHGYPHDDFQLIYQRLEEIKEKFGLTRVTFEAYMKCRDYLTDIKDSKEMMSLVAFQLLEWYIKICNHTAEAFETIDESSSALFWYQQSIQIVNFIANDLHPGSHLYLTLKSESLQNILQEIQIVSKHVLRLNSSNGFCVDNPPLF